MHILRVEHPVADFAVWKRAFDSDPARRQQSGVRRYRISRAVDEPAFVTVDLEFDSLAAAEAFLAALRAVWSRVGGTLVDSPRGRILDGVESKEY